MLTCPMCKKGVREDNRECPTCRTDLGLLVDYLSDLDGTLDKADDLTRRGELGQAVWAYLEVLEVDPDNPEAKRQIGQVATAVRQFDEVSEGRRWAHRIRKQAKIRKLKEDIIDVTPRGWAILAGGLILMGVMLLVGFGWGFQAAMSAPSTPTAPETPPSTEKDKSTKPMTNVNIKDWLKDVTNPKGAKPIGK
jgi:hypothetical protein